MKVTEEGKTDDITDNFNVNMYFANGLQFKGQFSITKTTSKTETFVDPKDASFQYSGITDDKKGSLIEVLPATGIGI